MLCIEETGTKTCLMDVYLFRNPEEVSHLCSSQARVVWFWLFLIFKTGLIISFFQLKKHNKHNFAFFGFFQASSKNKLQNYKPLKMQAKRF